MNEQQKQLREILQCHDALNCPDCGREIDRGDIAWNSPSTEAGTPMSFVEIICQGCQTGIAHVWSWWPGIDDFSDVLKVLEDDWNE